MSWRRRERQVGLEPKKVRDDVLGKDVPVRLPVNPAEREVVEFLLKNIALEFNIPLHSVLGDRRDRTTTLSRHSAIYLVYTWTGLTLSSIGEIFNRDHSTIHAALNKMAEAVEEQNMELVRKMLEVEMKMISVYRKKEE